MTTVSVRLHNAWSFWWVECVSVCRCTVGLNCKIRQKIEYKESCDQLRSCRCLFDKFWIWSEWNDRKRKLCESAETCREKNCEIMSDKLIFGGFEIFRTIVRLGIGNTSPTIFSMWECEYTLHSQSHTSFNINVLSFQKMFCWVEFSEVGKPEVVNSWKLLDSSVIRQHHVAKTYCFTNSNFDFVTCRGTRWPSNSSNRETRSRR